MFGIERNPGKVNEYLHLIDIKQHGFPNTFSVFLAEFNNGVVIIDCGTSKDVRKLLRYMKENNISLDSVKYVIASHHHFDHSGGLWKLYDEIKKYNPRLKIISSLETMNMLNNFENEQHFVRSRETWPILMGKLKKIEEDAFKIINSDEYYKKEGESSNIIDTFTLNDSEVGLAILETPGHAPGHISPLFIKNDSVDFIYFGEALGSLNHSKKLETLPSSAAPDFNYKNYMTSLKKIKELTPFSGGFAHFGFVSGLENVHAIIDDNEYITKDFRQRIIKLYREKPETKYIFDKLTPIAIPRVEIDVDEDSQIYQTLIKFMVTVVYGMMMDLGYRT